MVVKEITASELKQYIESQEYLDSKVIPITQHRAWSHIANPRVSPDDVVLILAYLDSHIVGYIGVLADHFFVNNQYEKFGWISCLWINPTAQGKGVVKTLLRDAFKTWNQKIAVTNFTPEVRGTYIRSDLFMKPIMVTGFRGYLQFSFHELLPPKKGIYKRVVPLLQLTDKVLNTFNNIRVLLVSSLLKKNRNKIEYVSEIDAEVDLFIKKFQSNNFTKREGVDLNWIIKNPWVLVASEKNSIQQRYYFSSVSKQFETFNIKVYNANNQLNAFVIITIRNGHLKVPYCFVDKDGLAELALFIYKKAIEMKCNMVTVFEPELREYMQKNTSPFLFKKSITQEYFISKAFGDKLTNKSPITFQYGDGDTVFT